VTAIDGHKIENDGTVEFRQHEYTNFYYFVDRHQMGEDVRLDIVRKRKPMQVKIPLNMTSDEMFLVKTTRYDKMPTYVIYGGYVFSPLTRNLIFSSSRNRLKLSCLAGKWQEKERDETVVLLKVLASDMSRGDNNFGMWPFEKVNGKTFKNFKEFLCLMQQEEGPYFVLEDREGVEVIIDRKEAEEKEKGILQKYNIEYDRSEDLRENTSGNLCTTIK
jgi:hypothetical protein